MCVCVCVCVWARLSSPAMPPPMLRVLLRRRRRHSRARAAVLATPSGGSATIQGFGGSDAIDHSGASATSLSYSGTFASGTLTVKGLGGVIATLDFVASYTTSNFSIGSDEYGGRLLPDQDPSGPQRLSARPLLLLPRADDTVNRGRRSLFFPWILRERLEMPDADGIWNLVLACRRCNRREQGKFAAVPAPSLIARLHERNEWLIQSHHPLRETIMLQTGADSEARASFLRARQRVALDALIHEWQPAEAAM